MAKLIITPKEEKSVAITIRIDRSLQEAYDELAGRTIRFRNELMGMALKFAIENMEVQEKE